MFYFGIVFVVVGVEVDALNSRSVNVDAEMFKSFVRLERSLLKEMVVLHRDIFSDNLFKAGLKGGKLGCKRWSAAG